MATGIGLGKRKTIKELINIELITSKTLKILSYKFNVFSNEEYILYGKVITKDTPPKYILNEFNIYGILINSDIIEIPNNKGLNEFSNIITTSNNTKIISVNIINAEILQLILHGNKRNQNNFNISIGSKIPKIYPYL